MAQEDNCPVMLPEKGKRAGAIWVLFIVFLAVTLVWKLVNRKTFGLGEFSQCWVKIDPFKLHPHVYVFVSMLLRTRLASSTPLLELLNWRSLETLLVPFQFENSEAAF